jgi:hypothetical protein
MEWEEAVEYLTPYVVKISTPQGSGTGFLLTYSAESPFCSVATAAHVIDHAHYWEQPIRLDHGSGKSVLLRHDQRAVFLDESRDTAAILFNKADFPVPVSSPMELTPKGLWLKTGIEVGWVGYPAVSPQTLCFFSGRVSAYLNSTSAYLVDGVSINGVSGGPTFFVRPKDLVVIGVVSAYIPNRATGDVLPGLAVIRDVIQFQELANTFKSLDQAKEEETMPTEPPPPQPEPGA